MWDGLLGKVVDAKILPLDEKNGCLGGKNATENALMFVFCLFCS